MEQNSPLVLPSLHARTYHNPDLDQKTCEAPGCSVQRERRYCFSFIVSLLYVHMQEQRAASGQCVQEQHWCCSHEHALLATAACIDQHHHAGMLKPYPPFYPLPAPTLEACEVCHTPLTTEAYLMLVCYATPGYGHAAYTCGTNYELSEEEITQIYGTLTDEQRAVVPTTIRQHNQHWCCSEACAKKAAHACMHEHLSEGKHG